MERCSNCGAATRPGAKFCTSCGTRLNLDQDNAQPAGSSWTRGSSTQETQVVTPPINWSDTTNDAQESSSEAGDEAETPSGSDVEVTSSPPETTDEGDDTSAEETYTASSWASRWPGDDEEDDAETPAAVDDESDASSDDANDNASPSSRFAAGPDGPETEESRFDFPERSSWAWDSTSPDEIDPTPQESETIEPSMSSLGSPAVDSDDSVIVVPSATGADATDPRERASALVDELRGLIWKIGEEESSGTGDQASIISDLTSVRGETGDFSDLRSAIDAVRDSPRDVEALRELGQQADRLQALLDSHVRLTSSLDETIRKLR